MSDERRRRAVVLAAALVGWSGLIAPRLPTRVAVPTHAVLGGALALWMHAPLGLASPRGARLGLPVAAAVSTAVAVGTGVPAVRSGMARRELPTPTTGWLLVRIPLGTVWPEEAAFRGALGTVAAQGFGPRWGRLLQATAFGLSHVADARGAREPVAPTVLVTGATGWALGWLCDRSGSLLAPMLAHLATNEAGALAALVVKARTSSFGPSSRQTWSWPLDPR